MDRGEQLWLQRDLKVEAAEFLKVTKPKEYKQAKRDGTLEEYCQVKAEATREYVRNAVEKGVPAQQARHWAVRVCILERDED